MARVFKKAIDTQRDTFESSSLIYPNKSGNTQSNSITLGWKGEITNRERALSAPLALTQEEMKDYLYKGINQTIEKRNAAVNGIEIEDSGVADYLLESRVDLLQTTADVLNHMVLIDQLNVGQMHLAFTANNYRAIDYRGSQDVCQIDGKTDSNRSLAVAIDWKYTEDKLTPDYIYDKPLMYGGGNDMKPNLIESLKKLGRYYPDEFIRENIANYEVIVKRGRTDL